METSFDGDCMQGGAANINMQAQKTKGEELQWKFPSCSVTNYVDFKRVPGLDK